MHDRKDGGGGAERQRQRQDRGGGAGRRTPNASRKVEEIDKHKASCCCCYNAASDHSRTAPKFRTAHATWRLAYQLSLATAFALACSILGLERPDAHARETDSS